MKKIMFLTAILALVPGARATTVVQMTQAAPGAPALTSEAMASYDCFIIKGGTLSKAMGYTPATSLAGVNEVVAYLNADFAANYATVLSGRYEMVRDAGKMDFRNSSGSSFGERFGVVVYNPVDGTKTGVDDIAAFRVFNLDSKSTINDSLPNSGYWSGWQNTVSTPEPTSGLLLLLGVAGLALRRKRR